MTARTFFLNRDALATTSARRIVLEAAEEAIHAMRPEVLLLEVLPRLQLDTRAWVLGAGKAVAGMAAAAATMLGRDHLRGGAVITARGAAASRRRVGGEPAVPTKMESGRPRLLVPGSSSPAGASPSAGQLDRAARVGRSSIVVLYGDHPVPDARSVASTNRLLALADRVGPDEVVLWLISGGASALLCAPAQGLTLEDKQEATRLLVRAGATIDEINAVRKHLSAVKGGLLGRRLGHAKVITLALSDVVSGRLDVIGSGPTVPDDSTYVEALGVTRRYGLGDRMPAAVMERLELGAAGLMPETPKRDDPCFTNAVTEVVGSPARAATAAGEAARKLAGPSAHVEVLPDQLTTEVRVLATSLGAIYRYWSRERGRPQVVVAAGEPTVRVTGDGKGGRCQELAAALIPEIEGLAGCAVACVATDGQDFIPGAGGALVDGETAAQARSHGLRVQDYLRRNDTNALHRRLGTLVQSRPTGTNVCDLVVAALNCNPA